MRSVIVTGASRGLGLGIARRLASDGYRVIAVARNRSEALTDAIGHAQTQARGEICFAPFDLVRIDAVHEFVRLLRRAHGPIWALVNNAGISVEGLLASAATADIEQVVRINVTAPMILTKHVARAMMSAGEGRVVNMSSIVASTGYAGLSVYAATKASMVGFTRSLARELGPVGVTVNAVAPGFVDTDLTAHMTPENRGRVANRAALRRMPGTEDVASAVAWLLSDEASNITGTVLTVDAGATA
ncbi:MAG: SDR family NAD(P)-dependent oxidoreductase [Beijerinckiaceae bacterium]